jgi:hypothetical protein
MSRIQAANPEKRLQDDIDNLYRNSVLETSLQIPNAATELGVVADLKGRTIRVSMTLGAPKDRKSNKARLNWLLRQIKDVEAQGLTVGAVWPSRAPTSFFPLAELREHPERIDHTAAQSEVRAFEVVISSASARRFMGRRTFIEELESLVPKFYELVGQHLQAWKPSPPKPKHSVTVVEPEIEETTEAKEVKNEEKVFARPVVAQAGNDHSSLLEIPDFLRRIAN